MNKRKERHLKRMAAQQGRLRSPEGKWGLLDTKDNYWLADSKGPFRFDEEKWAQIAARIMDYQLGWPAGRIRATVFTSATKKVDDVPVVTTAARALKLIESGMVI